MGAKTQFEGEIPQNYENHSNRPGLKWPFSFISLTKGYCISQQSFLVALKLPSVDKTKCWHSYFRGLNCLPLMSKIVWH